MRVDRFLWKDYYIFYFANQFYYICRNRSVCSVSWSNVLDPESFGEHYIKIFDFVNDFVITSITYLLPGIWMCYMYFWMHKALNISIVGEINNINLQALHERKKVSQSCLHFQLFIYLSLFFCFQLIKMLTVIYVVFIVTWLPYHLFFMIYQYFPINDQFSRKIFMVVFVIAISNGAVNPIIYAFLGKL